MVELNKAITRAKECPDLTLRYFRTPVEALRWGVVTDASFTNYDDGSYFGHNRVPPGPDGRGQSAVFLGLVEVREDPKF